MPIRRTAPAAPPGPAIAPAPAAAPVNGVAHAAANPDPYPALRPYRFHRAAGHFDAAGGHAVGDCPFCYKEGKFSIDVNTGLWKCWVCGTGTEAGGGNALVFIRSLHEHLSRGLPQDHNGERLASVSEFAADRKLLSDDTLAKWGVVRAQDGTWCLPGYGPDGALDQLYRRQFLEGNWSLLPTPGLWSEGRAHAWHLPVGDFDPVRPVLVVCEGPWDGMALWEACHGEFGEANIVAVPGCNVWQDRWTEFCLGKTVVLLFDSDHPVDRFGRPSRPGWDGMKRVASRIASVASAVRVVRWGPEGYDPDKPSGWDVRDMLAEGGASLAARRHCLAQLVALVDVAPPEWIGPATVAQGANWMPRAVETRECSRWGEVDKAWQEALKWRPELSAALATTLAVCASTAQGGNQLFMDLVGSPGSAKTTICKGLLTSFNCIHVENITKLLSGYKLPEDAKKDCSFIARANGKTWITCEFDTLLTSPQYVELMGKIRRIFDGETSSTYGNSDEDRLYTCLRTPWIRAGTFKMMDHDQSQLGDRFMRFILSDPPGNERREIARAALRSECAAMMMQVDGTAGSMVDDKTATAFSLTGGYVDWLRSKVDELLPKVRERITTEVEDYCIDLAELSADLRARPVQDRHKKHTEDTHDVKELPTRLARQNIRMAAHLAVVLQRDEVDADALAIVKKVALDTAIGQSLNVVQWLAAPNPRDPNGKSYSDCGGLAIEALAVWLQKTVDKTHNYLMFLRKIDVLEWRSTTGKTGTWTLTERVRELYNRIMGR